MVTPEPLKVILFIVMRAKVSVGSMSQEEPSESEEFVKIEGLTPRSRRVNVIVKVVSKSQVRDVTSRRDYSVHRVADALVGDETGCVYLTLWDDNIDSVKEGDSVSIKNGYINLFKNSMRLNIGRYGSFEVLEESTISEVNTENNLSEKTFPFQRRQGRY